MKRTLTVVDLLSHCLKQFWKTAEPVQGCIKEYGKS